MALDSFSDDSLIARLSWRPADVLNSMITVPEPIESNTLPRTLTSSSMGALDVLPTELLHIILSSSDFRTLSHFAQVCHQAKIMVESLPSYQSVMTHASRALIALSQAKLIRVHTAATIHAALLSDRCISCQNYAAFLFLPTCERCCYRCLCEEQSLRVTTLRLAGFCFGLFDKLFEPIPIMRTIPGKYSVRHEISVPNRVRLVSLKQAKQLGISIHGSQKTMDRVGVLKMAPQLRGHENSLIRWLAGSSENAIARLNAFGVFIKAPKDHFYGMASIEFPSLRSTNPDAELENGLWCHGCRRNFEQYNSTRKLDHYTRPLVPNHEELLSDDVLRVLFAMAYQARSRAEFLHHIKHNCKKAKSLLRRLENGTASFILSKDGRPTAVRDFCP